jgi:iron complex transport system permease protein
LFTDDLSARNSLDSNNIINRAAYYRLLLGSGITLAFLILAALCMGRYSMNPADVIRVIASRITGGKVDEAMANILFRIRLPRVTAAVFIGAALTLSGAAYQSTFRNPLISPDLLGVSSGASMGAAAAIFLGLSLQAIQLFAFAGGMLAVLLATSLPKLLRNSTNMMLVLSGIIVSGFMNAIIGIIKFISKEQDQLSSIVFWQMGSLARVNANQLLSVTPPILLCLAVMFAVSWRLNILSFGEEEARTVGVNVPQLRGLTIVCASLLTASSVCVSGTIGWIGLVIPHFGRLICGSDNTKLMPIAAILGGAFLLVIDTLARTATSMEIPLSILSGLIGAPFYAWLLTCQRAKIL